MTRSPSLGSGWVMVTVLGAAMVTLGLLVTMVTVAEEADSASTMPVAVMLGVFGTAIVVGWWTSRASDVALGAQGAVVVTACQLAVAGAAAALWQTFAAEIGTSNLPMLRELPAPQVALASGAALVVLAGLTARRRRGAPRWLQVVVVFSLAYLLMLACWLPIVVDATPAELAYTDDVSVGPWARGLRDAVLWKPAVAAAFLTLFVQLRTVWWRTPASSRAVSLIAGLAVLVAVTAAAAFRGGASRAANFAYGNYVHVLFAAAMFALLALVALAVSHARGLTAHRRDARRGAPWAQEGIVVTDPHADPVVGHVDDRGFLGGLRSSVGGFVLRTAQGDLPVPAGASLVVPLPGSTSVVVPGWRAPALVAGQHVVVTGFVAPAADSPFRGSSLLTPGPAGLVVTRTRGAGESISRDVLLLVWRPCVLFLVVAALAAFPGICGSYT